MSRHLDGSLQLLACALLLFAAAGAVAAPDEIQIDGVENDAPSPAGHLISLRPRPTPSPAPSDEEVKARAARFEAYLAPGRDALRALDEHRGPGAMGRAGAPGIATVEQLESAPLIYPERPPDLTDPIESRYPDVPFEGSGYALVPVARPGVLAITGQSQLLSLERLSRLVDDLVVHG